MRALLIVNPRATSTARTDLDAVVRRLATAVDLATADTRYRGHAGDLAAGAVADGHDVVVVFGGDGTINEAINGLMRNAGGPAEPKRHSSRRMPAGCADATAPGGTTGSRTAATADAVPRSGNGVEAAPRLDAIDAAVGVRADHLPMLAPLPGGGANVFVRSLGLPTDPVAAVDRVISHLATGQARTIGLGVAAGRYFASSAGLGLDAEVVRAVEELRARGRRSSPLLYLEATLRQYFAVTDRRHPALTVERDGHPPIGGLFCGIICNTTPWTYLGHRPLAPTPWADFAAGLDVFALRQLHVISTLNALRQMMRQDRRPLSGRHVVTLHDETDLILRASRPIAFQVDGEYVGEPELVRFQSVPGALRVTA